MNTKRKRQEEYYNSIDQIDFNLSLHSLDEPESSLSARKRNCIDFSVHNSMVRRNRANSRGSSGRGGGYGSRSSVDTRAVEAMFDEIAEEDDPSVAKMEGICKIAEQLHIDPLEDIRILVLLHKLGVDPKERPGQITREEWQKGCDSLHTDSIEKLQALVPSLDTGFMIENEFRDFYKFCFQFNRQGTYKTIEKDVVVALVEMVLKERIAQDTMSSFIQFLNETEDKSYERITLDQWMSFYDFSKECPDLSQYDEENSAWPVLIDDFVDFAMNNMQA